MPDIFNREQIEGALQEVDVAAAIEEGFVAYSEGRVVVPPVGELLFDEEGGNLVWSDGPAVALLGVEGLAVIDTGDVLLVTKLERSPDVRGFSRDPFNTHCHQLQFRYPNSLDSPISINS